MTPLEALHWMLGNPGKAMRRADTKNASRWRFVVPYFEYRHTAGMNWTPCDRYADIFRPESDRARFKPVTRNNR